jgi:GxxExxY protein
MDGLRENELAKIIVNSCYNIHRKLGPGLLESVYETVLCFELTQLGLKVERQKPMPVVWNDLKNGHRVSLRYDCG